MALQRLPRRFLRQKRAPASRRLRLLKRCLRPARSRSHLGQAAKEVQAEAAVELTETMRRNIALEAVRTGNYWAEDAAEVLRYIAEVHAHLLGDVKWLQRSRGKLRKENGLTRRYSVAEILRKQHEVDGFDVFVDADEACLMAERAAEKEKLGDARRNELTPGDVAEIQEGLDFVVAAAAGEDEPVGVEEILELLERAAAGGEVAASVYLGERLEALHEGKLPRELLARVFEALKPLLRPSVCATTPRLAGPWDSSPSGRFGKSNPRKGLGRLLERLAASKRAQEQALGGEAAHKAARSAEGQEVMKRFCKSLLPLLEADAEARRCRRRGPLAAAAIRVCAEQGLTVSNALAQALLQAMENDGMLSVRGRDVELTSRSVQAPRATSDLRSLADDLKLVEGLAKERMDRRRQRQQARSSAKRRRRDGGTGA